MRDDVTDLLASNPQQLINFSQNYQNLTISPNISLDAYKCEIINQKINPHSNNLLPLLPPANCLNDNIPFKLNSNCNNNNNNNNNVNNYKKSFANEFELQIKHLEEKARELRADQNEFNAITAQSNFNSVPYKLNDSFNYKISNTSGIDDSNDLINLPNTFNSNILLNTNFNQTSNSLTDVRNEENYLKQIKEKLDIQLKETEYLKKELNKSKQLDSFYPKELEPINQVPIKKNITIPNKQDGLIDEVVNLKVKLKESQILNEELKRSFKQNINQLQSALKDCVIDKDKLIDKKNGRIQILEEELDYLKKVVAEHQSFMKENESFEDLSHKIQSYEELAIKLRQLLVAEERKREKSYFVNDLINDQPEKPDHDIDILYKAIQNCLKDYQGELKHIKIILKELQNSWENKETQIEQKETVLNDQFNKKCETIRQEYDRLINMKQIDIDKLQNQVDELNTEMNQLKEKNRKLIDAKDVELNTLILNNDSLKSNLSNAQKELKQFKSRLETLRTKEKENQTSYNKSLIHLETDNEKLNNRCLDLSKELADSQTKYESTKCQLGKYEQLIDNLNEQVILLKREQKENQLNLNQMNQNFEIEIEHKTKLESRCQELEQQLIEFKDQASKHENCENNLMNLQIKLKQTEHSLHKKSSELNKISKKLEQVESKSQNQYQQLKKLDEEKTILECDLKNAQAELNDARVKFQNSACLIQHSCKANTLLKEEKDSMENVLKENTIKLKSLKFDFDKLNETNSKLELECHSLKTDNELVNKKLNELKKLNDIINNEKETCQKELKQAKNELSISQNNFKTLNKKLSQTISDKDLQISKLEQALSLYEKEISLLKQVETLHKNQEDSKVMEIASTVQFKLTQKKNKIEALKARVANLEALNESLAKEKNNLELELKNSNSKNESLHSELKKIHTDFDEVKSKVLQYEKALDKAAQNFTECERKNELLKIELFKLKESNGDIIKPQKSIADLISKMTSKKPDLSYHTNNNDNVQALNKLITMLMSNSFNNPPAITNFAANNNEKILLNAITNNFNDDSNENFLNNMKRILESTIDLEQTSILNNGNEDNQESNKELCNNIENKLSILNKIGLSLKKENHEVTQLLLQQQQQAVTSTNCSTKN